MSNMVKKEFIYLKCDYSFANSNLEDGCKNVL